MEDDGSRVVDGVASRSSTGLSHVFVGHPLSSTASSAPRDLHLEASKSPVANIGKDQDRQPVLEPTPPSTFDGSTATIPQEASGQSTISHLDTEHQEQYDDQSHGSPQPEPVAFEESRESEQKQAAVSESPPASSVDSETTIQAAVDDEASESNAQTHQASPRTGQRIVDEENEGYTHSAEQSSSSSKSAPLKIPTIELTQDTPEQHHETAYIEDVPAEFLLDDEDNLENKTSRQRKPSVLPPQDFAESAMEELDSWAVRKQVNTEAQDESSYGLEAERDVAQPYQRGSADLVGMSPSSPGPFSILQEVEDKSYGSTQTGYQPPSTMYYPDSNLNDEDDWLRNEPGQMAEKMQKSYQEIGATVEGDANLDESSQLQDDLDSSREVERSNDGWMESTHTAEVTKSPADENMANATDVEAVRSETPVAADNSWLDDFPPKNDLRESADRLDSAIPGNDHREATQDVDTSWLSEPAQDEYFSRSHDSPTDHVSSLPLDELYNQQQGVDNDWMNDQTNEEGLDTFKTHQNPTTLPSEVVTHVTELSPSLDEAAFSQEDQSQLDEAWKAADLVQDDLEDSWAAALGSTEPAAAASWDTAFEDMFEEDGFLDETLPAADKSSAATSAPIESLPKPYQPAALPLQNTAAAAYAAPYATRPLAPVRAETTTAPVDFFAELPVVDVPRSRKPLHQSMPMANLQGPPPPDQARLPGPPNGVPSVMRTPPVSQFRPPERLELFPQQDTHVSTDVPYQSPHSFPSPLPAAPPLNSSYIPTAPTMSPPALRVGTAPPLNNRYSPAPAPLGTAGLGVSIVSNATRQQSAHALPPTYAPAAQSKGPPPTSRTASYTPSAPAQPQMNLDVPPGVPPVSFKQPPLPISSTNDTPLATTQTLTPVPPPVNRYAPRTSSPLAPPGHRPHLDRSVTMPMPMPPSAGQSFVSARGVSGSATSRYGVPSLMSQVSTVDQNSLTGSISSPTEIMPPPRPRTQSPETTRSGRDGRYASNHRSVTMQLQPFSVASNKSVRSTLSTHVHERDLDDTNYLRPMDEQSQDQLQRWKGSPVFRWGSNGTVVSSFPQYLPRYGGGQAAPSIKCMPGVLRERKIADFLPNVEFLASFPGPLKAKNKKKDVITWLSARIVKLEDESRTAALDLSQTSPHAARAEERLLLWQAVRLIVEHDGYGTENTALIESARKLLAAGTKEDTAPAREATKASTQGEAEDGFQSLSKSPSKLASATSGTDGTDSSSMDSIKSSLMLGDREKAVWTAVDHRLWGHAMLIASTSSSETWKQVVQEFVRKEVRTTQRDNQPLAALYEVFAGNWDESIDALVPPSARAGFQMVSAVQGQGTNQNVLDGLSQWRETLGLILSNRSKEDERAILALGKLLSNYGRIEAAHFCYLFARSVATFGGADDENSQYTILGMDMKATDAIDLEGVLLTEVLEFVYSLSTVGNMQGVPHLQAYKLYHAYALAEIGKRSEALQYCDTIAATLKSTTRPSLYYHPTLINQTEDLNKRLLQSPQGSSSSWLKPPSMGKVSTKFGKMFESFVAGGDADKPSGKGGEPDVGPFSRVSEGTPTISRNPSSVDLYGSSPSNFPPLTMTNSRYAPSYVPRSSQEMERPGLGNSTQSFYQSSEFKQRPVQPPVTHEASTAMYGFPIGSPPSQFPSSSHYHAQGLMSQQMLEQRPQSVPKASYEPFVATDLQRSATVEPTSDRLPGGTYAMGGYAPASASLLSNELAAQSLSPQEVPSFGYEPTVTPYEPLNASYEPQTPVLDTPIAGYQDQSAGHEPSVDALKPSSGGYDPSAGGYEPSAGGYEPPSTSYQPYEPSSPLDEATEDQDSKTGKKKSFMDDDEDDEFEKRAAELKANAKRDKEVDDKVKKAAEADGKSMNIHHLKLNTDSLL